MSYQAPLDDMQFVMEHLAGLDRLATLPAYADFDLVGGTAQAILDEAAKVAEHFMAPTNRQGDLEGAQLADGKVTLPTSFQAAYDALAEGGWFGMTLSADAGGQGLPELLGTAAMEMWIGANMAFSLNPLLSCGAALALMAHASPEQIDTYVSRIASGQWSGTMNLTESSAGSDLSVLTTKAVPEGDHYRLFGQKIFITWGEHSLAENIVHLVLARTPDAPAGVKGISLFIVPKYLVNPDGSLGERNDVTCVSLEHKMGIHASPTCVMNYGEQNGAIGYLVGEESKGLAYMFTMMNEARMKVGLQGLGVAEAAAQQALAYAQERIQGRSIVNPKLGSVPIVHHADVQRMLLTQRSLCEAMRALVMVEAATMDWARHGPEAERVQAQLRVDVMIPIIKGWMTEVGQEVAKEGVQIHGGMGFIEETGAAQYQRDGRIAAIYEGTNGIQAQDLVARKLGRDAGAQMCRLIQEIREQLLTMSQPYCDQLMRALDDLQRSTEHLVSQLADKPHAAMAGAFDYMMQAGYVFAGWQMMRALHVVETRDDAFAQAKQASCHFYLGRILPRAGQHASAVLAPTDAWLDTLLVP